MAEQKAVDDTQQSDPGCSELLARNHGWVDADDVWTAFRDPVTTCRGAQRLASTSAHAEHVLYMNKNASKRKVNRNTRSSDLPGAYIFASGALKLWLQLALLERSCSMD